MTNVVSPYITHEALSFPLICQEIEGPHLTICPRHEPLQTWVGVEERVDRENPWSGVEAIISVVMGPCTYFMVAPRVSSHSY